MSINTMLLSDQIVNGDQRAVSRGISIVEQGGLAATDLIKALFNNTGNAVVIGVTGPPGVGKSSLVKALASFYCQQGESTSILAIDPSSPFSGGAILGDRIRMQPIALNSGLFIRSMATRGNLGGLANATFDASLILDAAGYKKVIIETVGVGQDEIDIAKIAHLTMVISIPGMGDDIQSMKAGVMEIGDVFIVNKADRDGVDKTYREIEELISLSNRKDEWIPPIIKTVAITSTGINEVIEAIEKYLKFLAEKVKIPKQQLFITEEIMKNLLRKKLTEFVQNSKIEWDYWVNKVAKRTCDPYTATEEILKLIKQSL